MISSAAPVSSETISQAKDTLAELRKQYPSWKSGHQVSKIYHHLLSHNSQWDDFKGQLGQLAQSEEGLTTPSLRDLALNDSISPSGFNGYLELLRTTSTHAEISQTIRKIQYETVLASLDRTKVWIVPMEDESSWSFYVVRPGGVHWYECGLLPADRETIRPCRDPSKGMTAAYVLLGIRLLSQGLPQVAYQSLKINISHWCTRLLIELTCKEIDPGKESLDRARNNVEMILDREKELGTSYFDDACGDLFAQDASTGAHSPEAGYDDSGHASSNNREAMSNRQHHTYKGSDRGLHNLSQEAIDIKNIMEVLSDATIAARCMGPAAKNDLPALCNIVTGKRIESYFQVRYCRQQIYDRLLKTGSGGLDEIKNWTRAIHSKSMQESFIVAIEAECKQWAALQQWCKNESCSEAALLCAIPKRGEWSASALRKLHERLENANDSLRDLLKDTERLSKVIVASDLPDHTLCIELYPAKRAEVFKRDAFTAFVSVDNNPVIRLERSLIASKRHRLPFKSYQDRLSISE